MSRVHANLADLEDLHGLLANSGATVHEIRHSLRDFLGRLSEDWRDAEYDRFVDVFLSTERALGAFVESSETYNRYLGQLILHLEEYLRTTLPSGNGTTPAAFRVSVNGYRDLARGDVRDAVQVLQPVVTALYARWPSLTPNEKLAGLQGLQTALASSQARQVVPLVSAPLHPRNFGFYDGQCITVNRNHLASPAMFWHLLDTVIHEDRHAYQRWSILNPGFHADRDQTRAWANNSGRGYLNPENVPFRVYRWQPVESDAFWFAESVVLGIIGRRHAG